MRQQLGLPLPTFKQMVIGENAACGPRALQPEAKIPADVARDAKMVLEETAFNVDYIGNGFFPEENEEGGAAAAAATADNNSTAAAGGDGTAGSNNTGNGSTGGGSVEASSSPATAAASTAAAMVEANADTPSIVGKPPLSPGRVGRSETLDSDCDDDDDDDDDDVYGSDEETDDEGYAEGGARKG